MIDYTFVVSAVSTTKGSRLCGVAAAGDPGSRSILYLVGVCACVDRVIHLRAQLLWVGSRNVVSYRAGFSISNAVILAKSPF